MQVPTLGKKQGRKNRFRSGGPDVGRLTGCYDRVTGMKKVTLRPHHILCERFLNVEFPERGREFQQVEQRVRDVTQGGDETLVEVAQGIDELCRVCPHCRDDRCQHPQGDEEAVRKWDNIIVTGLGVSYGETKTSKEWGILVREKAPLKFCLTRCPSKSRCTISP